MNFFPTIESVDCAEAIVKLPDSQILIQFRCSSKDYVALSTVFEVSRWSINARWGKLPSISSQRREAARRLAVEAILKHRRDYAQRQVEKFRRPFQRSFSF
ncbi:hypothetical protein JNK62_04040 [bacterium]|nr:hypothetical protein [bacterium]